MDRDQKIILSQTAAEYLAAATLDLFPGALLLGGRGTSRYFYYDFLISSSISKESLTLIEERLIYLIKTEPKVKKREMLSSNAAQLFISRGQRYIAEALLKTPEKLSLVCEIADFLDYCPYPFSLSWPYLPKLKLIDSYSPCLEGQKIRIIGVFSSDKEKLKTFLKTTPPPSTLNHVKLATEQQLFLASEEGVWIWLAKAEQLKNLLIQRWRQHLTKQDFKYVSTPSVSHSTHALLQRHYQIHLKTGYDKLAEISSCVEEGPDVYHNGLLQTRALFIDRFTHFYSEENFLQTSISSLHFILETPKILGFEFLVVLKGGDRQTRAYRAFQALLSEGGWDYSEEKCSNGRNEVVIEIQLSDALGHLWPGPFIALPLRDGKKQVLTGSAFGPLERLIGLLLEQHAGRIPLWLAPEQVRLIALTKQADLYAQTVQSGLQAVGIRAEIDKEKGNLAHRLYRSIVEKIPFAVILGDKEWQTKTLVVRPLDREEERMDLETLCERLKDK